MNSVENQWICSRFIEPEKLANLRTKQEIEVMNGIPWTRELPPSAGIAALWFSGKNQWPN
ncbi:hypothetical protein J5S76_06755 [Bacillus amyloliquefaciens]|nr:hypothetical protein [Bacillus amyloliquefaciens]